MHLIQRMRHLKNIVQILFPSSRRIHLYLGIASLTASLAESYFDLVTVTTITYNAATTKNTWIVLPHWPMNAIVISSYVLDARKMAIFFITVLIVRSTCDDSNISVT